MSAVITLNEQTLGRDDGPVLIMLHGLYGSGSNWRSVAKPFADNYRIILPDLRNHGRSPHHPDMDYRSIARDVIALLDRHAIGSAAVVGHSMGGKVAMALALMAPERVSHLMVLDIAPVIYAHKSEQSSVIEALQALDLSRIQSRDDADEALADAIPKPLVRQFLLTNLQRSGDDWTWRIPLAQLADALPSLLDWPASDYVQASSRPAIDARFPGARYHCLEGVGHWVHAQAPAAFIEQLKDCLAESQ
jgi:pimeloyl-ACP methyl ester carboxylesterase